MSHVSRRFLMAVTGLLSAIVLVASVSGQGIALSGVGPVNRSMAGAATAAPLDTAGAIHWNPATICALPGTQMNVGLELLLADEVLSSRLAAGSLGAGIPPVDLVGSTRGEPGVSPIPSVAFVTTPEDSCFTFGLGIFAIAGFNVNYPASDTNPILTPQPPFGLGLGRINATAEVLQIAPTVGCRVTERLSVGVAPTITMARISSDPAFLAPPNDANGDGFPTYGSAVGTRYHWGGGFQVGAYYETDLGLNLGASFKSPQWFEDFRFHSTNELGVPVVNRFEFDYPLIVSLGGSYSAVPCYLFALDVRYFNWGATDGFSDRGFRADGAIAGFGWRSTWSANLGVQRQLNDHLFVRLGYTITENPISNAVSSFNVATPLISEHLIYAGASFSLSGSWSLDVAYVHAFENSVQGPLQSPAGPVPGSSVASTVSADALVMGITVRL